MQFTSTTELARKGSKTFKEIEYATVMHNNKDIGMVIGGALYQKIQAHPYFFEDLLEDIEIEQNREVLQKKLQESLESGLSDLVI
jgi:hypothetical protein